MKKASKEVIKQVKKSEQQSIDSGISSKEVMDQSSLADRIDSIRETISDMRKHGKDTKIVELRLMELQQTAKFLSVTSEKKDYEKSLRIAKEIESDIEEIKSRPEKDNVGDEVRKAAEKFMRDRLDKN